MLVEGRSMAEPRYLGISGGDSMRSLCHAGCYAGLSVPTKLMQEADGWQ